MQIRPEISMFLQEFLLKFPIIHRKMTLLWLNCVLQWPARSQMANMATKLVLNLVQLVNRTQILHFPHFSTFHIALYGFYHFKWGVISQIPFHDVFLSSVRCPLSLPHVGVVWTYHRHEATVNIKPCKFLSQLRPSVPCLSVGHVSLWYSRNWPVLIVCGLWNAIPDG